MNKEEAFQPFMALKKQLEQIAASLGLTLATFGLIIEDDLDLCGVQCQFMIRPEAVMSDAEREQATFDREFEQIEIREQEKELQDKKIPQIKADLDEWLNSDE